MPTHQVTNQPPPLENYDLFRQDGPLVEGVAREGAAWAEGDLHRLGERAGSSEAIAWGAAANAWPPVLRSHDRFGNRIDEVEYDPSYHQLMAVAVGHGLHAAPWAGGAPGRGAHVARAAGFYLWSQVDAGHGCPISMTYSVLPALRPAPDLLARWQPLLTSRSYDPASRPVGEKAGALAGMAMTEKQGGSDVRANQTTAVAGDGGYYLTGHKWFCSAPMGDLFLVLAQAPGGLTCFALPRWRPDGRRNAVFLQRLKDKLGNRSNASAEIELDGAWAERVGDEGRGVATIIEMVNHTRLDCVIGAAAGMRQAVAQATHHCAYRQAFGRPLAEQPLMTAVLADLAVESEAATTVMLRLAGAYDRAGGDEHEARFRRLATAVAKYWVCKRNPVLAAEALECLGGNGYIEESIMPRLFRESPLNGIWEGSGNVICLDVLRAMARQPESVEAFFAEVGRAEGGDARLDAAAADLRHRLGQPEGIESRARRLVEDMALVLQGALLVAHGHPAVADAFCASRFGGGGRAFGTLPAGGDVKTIVARATPKLG
ncbi:MAG TPA: acyl-CoA dehydrogenase family protein [Acidimicrobiales bacterium]|nr:acyl-CoA dehydrogenase family protein [Acidimicrobiales bacterium]